ncbi:hypothetical protein [Spongiactinospora sp. TRM90649]|uniref:hypothetical protein n=1 Tax=Spongiactinospora sp. TRM90649 TaxID=3031114 RepID=UPI0023F7FCD7|nr:hypothetical protein [Spongiactinospora sp. TRM90649]MDF5754563.1 hypothetical protein [Spongiactinospora sp. TRM90649]
MRASLSTTGVERTTSAHRAPVALGIAWVVLVPAEMFGVSNGLGYAGLNARDNLDYVQLAATMLLIGLIGFLLDRVLSGSRPRG